MIVEMLKKTPKLVFFSRVKQWRFDEILHWIPFRSVGEIKTSVHVDVLIELKWSWKRTKRVGQKRRDAFVLVDRSSIGIISDSVLSCSLEELQICSNNYTSIAPDYGFEHHHLHRLYISNNQLTEWQSICRLGCLFPRLRTLIASENPLGSFRSDDDVTQCLSHLHTLSVDQVEVTEWSDIVALTKLPRLHALRIHIAPLLKVHDLLVEEHWDTLFVLSL